VLIKVVTIKLVILAISTKRLLYKLVLLGNIMYLAYLLFSQVNFLANGIELNWKYKSLDLQIFFKLYIRVIIILCLMCPQVWFAV
jgi:hypothetical protein